MGEVEIDLITLATISTFEGARKLAGGAIEDADVLNDHGGGQRRLRLTACPRRKQEDANSGEKPNPRRSKALHCSQKGIFL